MYAELVHEEFEFVGYNSRNVKKIIENFRAYADFGILRDDRENIINQDRLAEVVAIAKRWDVYLIVLSEVSEINVAWDKKAFNSAVLPNEKAVCFIQKGVVKTFLDSNRFVRFALKQNFLYLQEHEQLLNLEDVHQRTEEALRTFEKHAYDGTQLNENSKKLRQFLQDENDLMLNLKQMGRYMDTSVNRNFAENVYDAVFCIRLICQDG